MSKEIYLKDSNRAVLTEMQAWGFNVTRCGQCGEIKLHKCGVEELTCDSCGFTEDVCFFPDLYVVDETPSEFIADAMLEKAINLIALQYKVDPEALSEMVNNDINEAIVSLEEK